MLGSKMRYLFVLSIIVCAVAGAAESADSIPSNVVKSIEDSVTYDGLRHPEAVVTFVPVRPGDVVVDLAPNQGYYTKILSRIVGSRGIVYSMVPKYGAPVLPTARTDSPQIMAERAPSAAALAPVLAIANVSSYNNVRPMSVNIDQYGGNVPLPEQADVVFVADGYHDMHGTRYSVPSNTKPLDMLAVNRAIFDAMNSGGVYVIITMPPSRGRVLPTLSRSAVSIRKRLRPK